MNRITGMIILLFTAIFFSVLPTQTTYAVRKPKSKLLKPVPPKKKVKAAKEAHYNYVRSHDKNGDGVVDDRDRLMWFEDQTDEYESTVLVSSDNEDIVGAMDLDGDGNVDSAEMQYFYAKYDMNSNGVLEEEELGLIKE
ncbi:MAG: hypothetical protein P9L90_07240 [Candidatus Aadella gelida]|nr:hypothetical protein [Candidatus Aadella gelida]